MKTIVILLLFIGTTLSAQTIDIYESTLKIPAFKEESYMCGLAEGDQLIFDFEEIRGRELKEVEIIEYPSASKFMDYKTRKISNKTISISKTGIYKFRFANSAMTERICKFKLQRIPASELTRNFNTSVYYSTVRDTSITILTDQTAKVHSKSNPNGNRTTLNFVLPKNTVAWSYYIGVDQTGQESFELAARQLANSASPLLKRFPGYGPMAALAIGAPSFLSKIQAGEDIDFVITDDYNAGLYNSGQAHKCVKSGKVLNDFSRMTEPTQGNIFICLNNDNAVTGVAVTVKVTAITVTVREEPHLYQASTLSD